MPGWRFKFSGGGTSFRRNRSTIKIQRTECKTRSDRQSSKIFSPAPSLFPCYIGSLKANLYSSRLMIISNELYACGLVAQANFCSNTQERLYLTQCKYFTTLRNLLRYAISLSFKHFFD